MTSTEPASARTATIVREMNVPARYIFLAFSKPEYLKEWFGPVGYPVTTCNADFRVGGQWRMAMTGPDGVEGQAFGGTYLDITPYSRIVYDNAFEAPNAGAMNLQNAGTMTMITTFDEVADKTVVTLITVFATVAMMQEYMGHGMEAGTLSSYDQLETLAQKLAKVA